MIEIRVNSFNPNDQTKYVTQKLLHDSGTPKQLDAFEIARQDGAKIVNTNYKPKTITIEGYIKGTSQSDLEYNIDYFKRYMSVDEANLDIEYSGRYRRYVVYRSNISIARDHFNITFAPFSVEFIVADPPFGKECTLEGDDTMSETWSADRLTNLTETFSAVFSGSAEPKPRFDFIFDTVGNLGGITLKNETTYQELSVYTAFSDTDLLRIDNDNKTVQKNYTDVEFEGVFPETNLGTNNFTITTIPVGSIDVEQTSYDLDFPFDFAPMYFGLSQSFQVSGGNYTSISILLKKAQYNTHDAEIVIQTDSGGSPSGTPVANAESVVDNDNISTSYTWVNFPFVGNVALSSSTTYHIKFTPNSGLGLYWAVATNNPYANGNLEASGVGGSYPGTDYPTYDGTFRIYKVITQNWEYSLKSEYNKRYL